MFFGGFLSSALPRRTWQENQELLKTLAGQGGKLSIPVLFAAITSVDTAMDVSGLQSYSKRKRWAHEQAKQMKNMQAARVCQSRLQVLRVVSAAFHDALHCFNIAGGFSGSAS
jgi:hypothetical protein